MSGNHRLDDNKAERARCLEAGCEVSSSCLEGRPVGPLRVWPGGLAMSRTLGDHDVRPCHVSHDVAARCNGVPIIRDVKHPGVPL